MRQLMVVLVLLLVSCGAPADVTQTPEAIHVRWLAAVRANDRAAALDLVHTDMAEREIFVDETLRTMQDLMTTPSSPTGALLTIETRAPTEAGQGKRAISVWHFANKTWCYATDLTAIGDGWRVAQWGQLGRCPS